MMRSFRRSRAALLLWVALALTGMLEASWGGLFVQMYGHGLSGLSAGAIEAYDLRPFPLAGASTGTQLAMWRVCSAAWCLAGLSGAIAFAGLVDGNGRRPYWLPPWAHRALPACALLSVGVATLFLVITHHFLGSPRERTYPIATLAGVERMSDLQFPPGAQLVEAAGLSGWHGNMRAVLRVPMHDVSAFLEAPPFGETWSPDEVVDGQTMDLKWLAWAAEGALQTWRPESVEQPLMAAGYRECPKHDTCQALVDLGEGNMATVYIAWDRH